jgi:succinyl-CoA synthetase beta subunit
MSKLLEYRGKEVLKRFGFSVPRGLAVTDPAGAAEAFDTLKPGVLKAQVYTTGRAALGLVRFPETAEEAAVAAEAMLGKTVKEFRVDTLLYEEKLAIEREFFAGVVVDTARAAPVLLFSSRGGSGIEEIAAEHPESVFHREIDPDNRPRPYELIEPLKDTGLAGPVLSRLSDALVKLIGAALDSEARSLEINPLVLTREGRIYAADCHMTVDDYAVFRHPEFGIEIARELGHPPTPLEKIAYGVEKHDYRGTFYFIQLEQDYRKGDGVIGFHGAGGGGSMMSMDALDGIGCRAANFCDTSGNPPASKIYRAARIILAQKNIDGYFGSGSGVASQEQYPIARGLVKALREVDPRIPVVFRLGGNGEEKAIRIFENYTKDLRCPVKGYGKDTPVSECAAELSRLIREAGAGTTPDGADDAGVGPTAGSAVAGRPGNEPEPRLYRFSTVSGGTVAFDHSLCLKCVSKVCIEECQPRILIEEAGVPVLRITPEAAASGGCTECLACEVECRARGEGGGTILLPLPGLDGEELL